LGLLGFGGGISKQRICTPAKPKTQKNEGEKIYEETQERLVKMVIVGSFTVGHHAYEFFVCESYNNALKIFVIVVFFLSLTAF